MRSHFTNRKKTRKPQAGDEKTIRGIVHIRQQVYSKLYRAFVVSNGRPCWEWVVKGGEKDRRAQVLVKL